MNLNEVKKWRVSLENIINNAGKLSFDLDKNYDELLLRFNETLMLLVSFNLFLKIFF